MEPVRRVVCSVREEIQIALKDVGGTRCVELRAYTLTEAGRPAPPARDPLIVPLAALPALVAELTALQASDHPAADAAHLVDAAGAALRIQHRADLVQPTRQYPRVAVRYQLTCTPASAPGAARAPALLGELRDVSLGGAQLGLPIRLELYQRVGLHGFAEEQLFAAHAEVVNVALWRQRDSAGYVRHGLRWRSLELPTAALLRRVLGVADTVAFPCEASARE